MIRTRVGYCGGAKQNPTYHDLGDHTETIEIDFDPQRISYEQLLRVFWTAHNPCGKAWSRQYRSAIFYHDDAQRQAIDTTKHLFVLRPDTINTAIEPYERFWLAEDYHQKYRLRYEPELAHDLIARCGGERGFVDSTAAARLNGYLDGHGTRAQLEREIERLGLSPADQQLVRQHVR